MKFKTISILLLLTMSKLSAMTLESSNLYDLDVNPIDLYFREFTECPDYISTAKDTTSIYPEPSAPILTDEEVATLYPIIKDTDLLEETSKNNYEAKETKFEKKSNLYKNAFYVALLGTLAKTVYSNKEDIIDITSMMTKDYYRSFLNKCNNGTSWLKNKTIGVLNSAKKPAINLAALSIIAFNKYTHNMTHQDALKANNNIKAVLNNIEILSSAGYNLINFTAETLKPYQSEMLALGIAISVPLTLPIVYKVISDIPKYTKHRKLNLLIIRDKERLFNSLCESILKANKSLEVQNLLETVKNDNNNYDHLIKHNFLQKLTKSQRAVIDFLVIPIEKARDIYLNNPNYVKSLESKIN